MHGDSAIEQWRREVIQRLVALDIPQKYGGFWKSGEGREAGVDMVPKLMNIADENEGHAVPGKRLTCYDAGMGTLCKPPLIRTTATMSNAVAGLLAELIVSDVALTLVRETTCPAGA